MSADDIFVIGVGRTSFTRDAAHTIKTLSENAVSAALTDAGLTRRDIGAAFFANAGQGALENQHMIRGEVALRHCGFEAIPIVNVENACASAMTALYMATMALRAGESEVVLALGAERLAAGDAAASKDFFKGALDVAGGDADLAQLIGPTQNGEDAAARSIFMDLYAGLARGHMQWYGTM